MSTNICTSCFSGIAEKSTTVFNSARRNRNSAKASQSTPEPGQSLSTPAQNVPLVHLNPVNQTTANMQGAVTPNNASSTSPQSHPAQPSVPTPRPSPVIHPTPNSVPMDPTLTLHQNPTDQAASISRPVTPLPTSFTPDPALKVAIERYVAELSDHDKAAFISPEKIIDKMREIDQTDSRSNLCRSFGDRIGKILHSINGFVDSVAICIQHNPDISALVVGGLHCVLRLVLNYIEFFESLTQMMEQIGGHLQYLSKYSSWVFQNSPDVQNALVNAYCDLLDFFVAVRGVFTDKEGRISYMRSFKLFLRVNWEPFELKFKPIEYRFSNHSLVVVRSAGVEHLIMEREKFAQKDQEEEVEKRRKVLEWLSPIDYEETHQRNNKKRFSNTGQWLLDHPDFKDWEKSLKSSLLWCYGNPGAGKTVLASLVLEHLAAQYELSDDTGITFLYCNYTESHKATTYIRVIIKQLSRRMPKLPTELETLYKKHYPNASHPGYTELKSVFIEILKQFKEVFLILDALDECTDNQKQELFDFFHSIITPPASNSGKIKLFITSREEPDIRRAFKKFPTIKIEAKKVDADIEPYVTAQLDQYLQDGTLGLSDLSLKDEIITTLVSKAGGMFLWVEFQLKNICSQISDHNIKQALGDLPKDVEETYERIINSIKGSGPRYELARKTLMWIAYAERPLLEEELVEAVAMEKDINCYKSLEKDTKSCKSLEKKVSKIEIILDACKNLVVLDETEKSQRTVQFVHFSIQEFLLKGSPDYPAVSLLRIEPESAHTEIAQLCITFLMFCQYSIHSHIGGSNTYAYTPLFAYAESAWYKHIRAIPKISEDLIKIILEFFKFGVFFERDSRVLFSRPTYAHGKNTKFSPSIIASIFDLPLVSKYLENENNNKEHPEDLYAMHYAARQNSCNAVEQLCNRGLDVSQLDTHGCTPLYYAAGKEVCKLLLDRGADANAQGGHFGSVLQAAAQNGNREVVQMLLDWGADANAQGGHYGSALQAASHKGSRETVQILLDHGANVNAQGGEYGGALQAATHNDNREIVQILLDKKANVNAQDKEHGTVLQVAIHKGSISVVQLLLERGADVRGGKYGGALHTATHNDNREMVQLLLDSGVDANANVQDKEHGTALKVAAFKGSKEMVQLLLDGGADVNAQSGKYGSVLQEVAYKGSRGMVLFLLDKGGDVNAQGGKYGSVLQAATRKGSIQVVQLLLERGADVNAQGGKYGSALQAAAYKGSRETVQLLLGQGADANVQGGLYGSVLQAATFKGSKEMVKLLLGIGVDVNGQGGKYGSALQAAAHRGSKEMVKLLLDKGAGVNAHGGQYGSALQVAADKGSREIVELLLSRGADVSVQGGYYGSALQAAAYRDSREIVKLLLDKGADVNAQGGEYGSVLQAAAYKGSKGMVKLLLDRGADVNVQGGKYGGVLQAAKENSNTGVVETLKDWMARLNAQGKLCALEATVNGGYTGVGQLLPDNGVTS